MPRSKGLGRHGTGKRNKGKPLTNNVEHAKNRDERALAAEAAAQAAAREAAEAMADLGSPPAAEDHLQNVPETVVESKAVKQERQRTACAPTCASSPFMPFCLRRAVRM